MVIMLLNVTKNPSQVAQLLGKINSEIGKTEIIFLLFFFFLNITKWAFHTFNNTLLCMNSLVLQSRPCSFLKTEQNV